MSEDSITYEVQRQGNWTAVVKLTIDSLGHLHYRDVGGAGERIAQPRNWRRAFAQNFQTQPPRRRPIPRYDLGSWVK